MRNLQSFDYLKIALAIIYLLCLFDMPYGFFQLVRFVGMVGFGVLAFSEMDNENKVLFVIWTASAILINPIFKIALGREIWKLVDVIWAILLSISLIISIKNRKLE
jgi:hypothetical protein